jgi:hypothetical protein
MAVGTKDLDAKPEGAMRHAVIGFLLVPGLAGADTVYLEGGRKLDGVVVERTDRTLVLEIGPGRVGIPLSRVVKVVPSNSPLAEYRKRAQELQSGDVAGWLRLADWAQGSDLKTQAGEACEQVLRVEPANATAQRCLGRVLQDGQWMSFEESQRARGLVQYGSQWVTTAEHERLVASESESSMARKAQAEAVARVREAEARAREAEARALAAENDSDRNAGGQFLWPVYGGGVSVCHHGCGPGCARPCAPHPAPSGTTAGNPIPHPDTTSRPRPRRDSPAASAVPPKGAALQPPLTPAGRDKP